MPMINNILVPNKYNIPNVIVDQSPYYAPIMTPKKLNLKLFNGAFVPAVACAPPIAMSFKVVTGQFSSSFDNSFFVYKTVRIPSDCPSACL